MPKGPQEINLSINNWGGRRYNPSNKTFFLNQDIVMAFFVTALGLMMFFEGIPYLGFPSRVKAMAQKIPELPDSTLRVIGFFIMILGLGVVYIGRNVIK